MGRDCVGRGEGCSAALPISGEGMRLEEGVLQSGDGVSASAERENRAKKTETGARLDAAPRRPPSRTAQSVAGGSSFVVEQQQPAACGIDGTHSPFPHAMSLVPQQFSEMQPALHSQLQPPRRSSEDLTREAVVERETQKLQVQTKRLSPTIYSAQVNSLRRCCTSQLLEIAGGMEFDRFKHFLNSDSCSGNNAAGS